VKYSALAVIALAFPAVANAATWTFFFVVYPETQNEVIHQSSALVTGLGSDSVTAWGLTMRSNHSLCYYEYRPDLRPGDSDPYASAAYNIYAFEGSTDDFMHDMCWVLTTHTNVTYAWILPEDPATWTAVPNTPVGTYLERPF
jgi:hypothetical protein